jgi:hypothetical protein
MSEHKSSGPRNQQANEIAAAQLGEQLAITVARIETTTDDLAALDRGDRYSLSPEGRNILEHSGPDGLRRRLADLEAQRANVAAHADRLRAARPDP